MRIWEEIKFLHSPDERTKDELTKFRFHLFAYSRTVHECHGQERRTIENGYELFDVIEVEQSRIRMEFLSIDRTYVIWERWASMNEDENSFFWFFAFSNDIQKRLTEYSRTLTTTTCATLFYRISSSFWFDFHVIQCSRHSFSASLQHTRGKLYTNCIEENDTLSCLFVYTKSNVPLLRLVASWWLKFFIAVRLHLVVWIANNKANRRHRRQNLMQLNELWRIKSSLLSSCLAFNFVAARAQIRLARYLVPKDYVNEWSNTNQWNKWTVLSWVYLFGIQAVKRWQIL